jgi:hypothetical protein
MFFCLGMAPEETLMPSQSRGRPAKRRKDMPDEAPQYLVGH